MGAIIDTSFIIPLARKGKMPGAVLREAFAITRTDVLAVSAITVLELEHGIHRASSVENQARRKQFLDDLCSAIPVHSVTLSLARLAGEIEAELASRGHGIELADLLIGVTVLELGYSVQTLNVKHFQRIPNLAILP